MLSSKLVHVVIIVITMLINVDGRHVRDVKSETYQESDGCFKCGRACSPGYGQCCTALSCSIRSDFWNGAHCAPNNPFDLC